MNALFYSARYRNVLIAILVVTLVAAIFFGRFALLAVDRYMDIATSVRALDFVIAEIDWKSDDRRLDLALEVHNGGMEDVLVDEARFSVYIEGEYVTTNPDTRIEEVLDTGRSVAIPYSFILREHFADIVDAEIEAGGSTWNTRGVVWIEIQGLEITIPLRARWEAES
ncbi:MAG: hypothetical protein R6U92_05805 [Bacillota bacterium]